MCDKELTTEEISRHFGIPEPVIETGAKKPRPSKPKKTKESAFPLDLHSVVFTNHAISQFQKRLEYYEPQRIVEDHKETALRMLGQSEEEFPHRRGRGYWVRRLLNNGLEPTRYFCHSGWRFVITENPDKNGNYVVITIERKLKRL